METIGSASLRSFTDAGRATKLISNSKVRGGNGCQVRSYLELATKVAELQYGNPDYVFLFRGQTEDYHNSKGNTSLKPSLFRSLPRQQVADATLLTRRFEVLKEAEKRLIRYYSEKELPGLMRLKRYRVLRWSLLQHYEICSTPFLDVTHSLRIAASFASIDAINRAYIFVLGVPNLSGSVTASAESGLQIIRLSSVCPPMALRPHIQEGYLLGEYPEMADFSQKENYRHHEIDFGRRMIAKFTFDPNEFWTHDEFPKVPRRALYPDQDDPLFELAREIKIQLPPDNY